MRSALQPHLFRILPPTRKRPAQGRGVHLPSPGLLQKHRTRLPQPSLDLAPLSGLPSILTSFLPYMTASRNDTGRRSPIAKKQRVYVFSGYFY